MKGKHKAYTLFVPLAVVVGAVALILIIGRGEPKQIIGEQVTFTGKIAAETCKVNDTVNVIGGGGKDCTINVGKDTVKFHLTTTTALPNRQVKGLKGTHEDVGKEVKIFAVRVAQHSYSLAGSDKYYIKPAQ